ncbi:5-carboxymethyl-2-hydroxymuconate Delta-isomerase [Rhizobiales bacterium 3FA27D7]|uniref:5-carboxymethyl-2-hydroxymuconate Delta-isomerase n=1 Tax=Mesorhizobium sp. 2RAF21 TaxID=3232995 RepID=UPI0010F517E0
MPHMAIEYSANLDAAVDMDGLCALVADTMLETGLFEIGAIRVRAFRAQSYAIADRLPQNGFIDMNLRIGKGRSAEEKKSAGEAIFAAVSERLAELFATPHFALSLEIREIDAELSWKKNAIHPRLRGK